MKYLKMFVMVLIGVFCLEMLAKVYLEKALEKSTTPKFRFSYYKVYEHQPYFKEGKNGKWWIVINKNGFRRVNDVSRVKPKNTFRVFLLGGSAAHGISSAPPYPLRHIYPEETIDGYLEKMLSARHPGYNIEVINAAVTGYSVFHHTMYLLSELLNYNPDLVIFFDGHNDHYANNPDYDYYNDNIYQFWKKRLQGPSIEGLFDYWMLFLSNHSVLARSYFAWKLQADAARNGRRIDQTKKYANDAELIVRHKLTAQSQFLRSIDINLLLLQHFNINAIVCLQPELTLRNKNLLAETERKFLKTNEEYRVLYPIVKDELENLTDKYKVRFVDMVSVFNSESYAGKQLFIDYCHLTPDGSRLAAETLLPVVEAYLRKT